MIVKSYILEKEIDVLKKNLFLLYGENLGLKEELKKNIRLKFNKAKILMFAQEEVLKNSLIDIILLCLCIKKFKSFVQRDFEYFTLRGNKNTFY